MFLRSEKNWNNKTLDMCRKKGKLKIVNFRGYKCYCKVGRHTNKQRSLVLIDIEDGMQVARASVSVDDKRIDLDEDIIIKSWSENIGIHDALVEAGVIKKFHKSFPLGLTYGLICKFIGV
jgi:hypothetical protein